MLYNIDASAVAKQLADLQAEVEAAQAAISWVDPTSPAFGADASGVLDSTAAINAAMVAAASAGAEVRIPPGTYKLSPDANGDILILPAGLRALTGTARTVLRLADGVANYFAILSDKSNDLSSLVVSDLTFDQNNTGNPIVSAGAAELFTGRPRLCIYLTRSTTRSDVVRCRFADTGGVNTVAVTALTRDKMIADCAFEVGTHTVDFDHSAIYTNDSFYTGAAVWILRNTFSAPQQGGGSLAARTAMETHGGHQVVRGNLSRGYQKFGNLTGIATHPGAGITWADNHAQGCKFGIQLWSHTYSVNLGPDGLRGVVIRDNTLQLDGAAWAPLFAGNGYACGIFLDTSADLPFKDVEIVSNRITFSTTNGYVGQVVDSPANGIDWRRLPTPGTVVDERITIRGNTIDSPTASGIRLATRGTGFRIEDNVVRNPGQGSIAAGGALSNSFACGIIVAGGAYDDTSIDRNVVLDDQVAPTTNYGLYLLLVEDGERLTARGNRIPVANSKPVETDPTFGTWLIAVASDGVAPLPAGLAASGSEFHDISTGARRRQTVAPAGSTWKAYTPGLVTAQDLAFAVPGTLRLPGIAGNYLSTPATPAMDIADAFRIRIDVALDDWSVTQYLCARWTSPTTTLVWGAYIFAGRLQIAVVSGAQGASSALLGASPGDRLLLEITVTQTTGTVAFRKSSDGGMSWTPLAVFANTIGGAFVLPTASGVPLSIGGGSPSGSLPLGGQVFDSEFYDVSAASVVSHLSLSVPAASMVDDQGGVWTMHGGAWTIEDVSFVTAADLAAEALARTNADALALLATGNLGELADKTASRIALQAQRKLTRYSVPNNWKHLSHLPQVSGPQTTMTLVSGRVYYVPYASDYPMPFTGFAIEVTNTPSAATYVATFALYTVGPTALPDQLVTDWTSLGSLNLLTGGPAYPPMTFAAQVLPAGEYNLAMLVLGTGVVTPPVIRALAGPHPSVGATAPFLVAGGYIQSGLTAFPSPAAPSNTTGVAGPMIYGKLG